MKEDEWNHINNCCLLCATDFTYVTLFGLKAAMRGRSHYLILQMRGLRLKRHVHQADKKQSWKSNPCL